MIYYRRGNYAYQLERDHVEVVPELRDRRFTHAYFSLREDGTLVIKRGYAWDGLTYALDDKLSLRASLIHDVVCQAVNEGLATLAERAAADTAFKRIMIMNGRSSAWATARFWAVSTWRRLVGVSKPRPVLTAP